MAAVSTSKPDTRILLTTTDLLTDLSQWAVDLTAAGAAAYEEESERTAINGDGRGRSLEIDFEADTSSAGVLIDHGGGDASPSYQLKIKSNAIECNAGLSTLGSLPLPDLDGSLAHFVASWSTEPNPLTTGGSDALRSELTVFNAGTGTIARLVFEHAVTVSSVLDHLGIGGVWSGALMNFAYTDTIHVLRISSRYHTSIETREDFVLQTTAPSVDGWVVAELQRLPAAALEVAELAGPQYQVAAPAAVEHRARLASPLVQAMFRDWPVLGADLAAKWPPNWVTDLGDDWQTTAAWLWRCEVPKICGWIVARIQVAVWATDANPPSQLEVRISNSDAPPGQDGTVSSEELTRAVDDGVDGTGVLAVFDRVFVNRDDAGRSWVWLASRLVGANATTRYAIRQITIAPLSVPSLDLPEEPADLFSP
jgi:hypothetical protein